MPHEAEKERNPLKIGAPVNLELAQFLSVQTPTDCIAVILYSRKSFESQPFGCDRLV